MVEGVQDSEKDEKPDGKAGPGQEQAGTWLGGVQWRYG